ncbi:MAG: trypsin-like peptidase domain-containing protein [Defluviitaleaceae bacterium]|nr:trypsin-like peptidase domain-containing protein [Defluviitaleaceae bacterium]
MKKRFLTMICAVVLMLGSGYAGAMIANQGMPEPYGAAVHAAPSHIMPVTHAPSAAHSLTLPDLFDYANPAVVAISTEVTGRNAFGQLVRQPAAGSGFLVSPNGYIVTNSHVIENVSSITVLLYDGSRHPAALVGHDPVSDLAVIKIDGESLAYLPLGNSDLTRVGDQVAAIGNPLGELANSMTVGHISALSRDITIDGITRDMLQTDAAVNSGNSGGPLLNLQGEVIGIVTAKSVGANVEGLGFAIASNHAIEIVQNLMNYGFVRGRALLGVQIHEAQDRVQVASVSRNSAADRAGLLAGDIILYANGHTIRSFDVLRGLLDELFAGDAIELRVRRGNQELSLTAVLDEYRPVGL